MASQVHINSSNLCLKILNLGLRTSNLGLKEKVHINDSNKGLKFQIGVLAGQMHIISLNLRLTFKPRFENLNPSFENFKHRFEGKDAH